MALQTIKGGLWIPGVPPIGANNPAFSGRTLDAATKQFGAVIFRVPRTGTLDKFEFRVSGVAQAPVNGLRCSFQDVGNVTGDPTGTQTQFFRTVTGISPNSWITPGILTSDGTDGGTKLAITQDEDLACCVAFENFVAGDSVDITYFPDNGPSRDAFTTTYIDEYNGTSWAKLLAGSPIIALKYDDGSYEYVTGFRPFSSLNNVDFSSSSSPNERGMIFQFPGPVKIRRGWFSGDIDGNADAVIYAGDGVTPLMTRTLQPGYRSTTLASRYEFPFPELTLSAGVSYRYALKPATTTNIRLHEFDVAAAAIMDQFEGGQNFHHTSRTGASAWTEVTTKRPLMGLCVSAIDDAVQTGGGGGFIFLGE